MGFAKGGADVALEELGPAETLLNYTVKAQVGGKMAQLGARLIDSTAKQMADQFFDRFAARLTPAAPVADALPSRGTAAETEAASAAQVAMAPRPVSPATAIPSTLRRHRGAGLRTSPITASRRRRRCTGPQPTPARAASSPHRPTPGR